MTISRRVLLGAALALPFPALAQSRCGSRTPEDMEGPFYKSGAPSRASLAEKGAKAQRLALTGAVLGANCEPIGNVVLDFWHADEQGAYDHAGYRYRGVVVADAQGRYRLDTILPPPYMGRPRHIHVKVGRRGGRMLTTQLYFPGESRGADSALVVRMERGASALAAAFDFVIAP